MFKRSGWISKTGLTILSFVGIVAMLLTVRSSTVVQPKSFQNPIDDVSREELASRLHWLLGEGAPESIDPDPRIEYSADVGDHFRQLISYWTEPGDRATGWLLIPKSTAAIDRRLPLVLCLHQTTAEGKDSPIGLSGDHRGGDFALDLVRRGFVCFAPDEFCAGDRAPACGGPFDTTVFYRDQVDWSAPAKALWDLQHALDFLAKLPFVDQNKIGVIGHSHGAHNALMLAALDERISATVVHCGPKLLRSDPRRAEFCRDDPSKYLYYPRLAPFLADTETLPFDFDIAAYLTAPRDLLIVMNRNETDDEGSMPWTLATLAIDKRLERDGLSKCLSVRHFVGWHGFTDESRQIAYEWIDRKLMPKGQFNNSISVSRLPAHAIIE